MLVRLSLKQLLATVALWALLIAFCFLYSFLHPSRLAYAGLALLVLWFVYIPLLFLIVFAAWPVAQSIAGRKRTAATRT